MHWYGKTKHCHCAAADLGLRENLQRTEMHLPSELGDTFAKLEDWMRVLGYVRRDIFAVQLALDEAVTNAFRHGNRGDPAKSIRISYLVTPDKVLVAVEDEGRGFNPALVPDPLTEHNLDRPGGRGLLLMRAYTSWVSFDPPGNRVTFCRWRSHWQAPRPSGPSGPAGE